MAIDARNERHVEVPDADELRNDWGIDGALMAMAVAHGGLDLVQDLDVELLADDDLRWLADNLEQLLRRANATLADVLGAADRRGLGREHGCFSTRAWTRHRHQLAGATAFQRTQTMRLFQLLPGWAESAREGHVGIDQTVLMARVASNRRIHVDLVAHAERLLDDAEQLPYPDFERRLRTFERLADPDGAAAGSRLADERRDARIHQRPDLSWTLTASLPGVPGAEFAEAFAHLVDAEWHTDWNDARERCADEGREATVDDLARTEPQRRADALLAMARAAAEHPGPGRGPLPTLDVLIDERTLQAAVLGEPIPASRYRDVVCRTQGGAPLDVHEAAGMALWAHVRRVVHDGAELVIELGRRRRLFTGASRDAVLLMATSCVWPGCGCSVRNTEVDHAVGWRAHGATVPRNGVPLCRRHNLWKERGRFTVHRSPHGRWRILGPDGHPVD